MTEEAKPSKLGPNFKNKLTTIFLIKIITFYFFLAVGIGTMSGILVAYSQGAPDFNPDGLEAGLPSIIKDREGKRIVTLDRDHRREEVSIDEVPNHVVNAFIAIEDSRFYEHSGIDIKGILRAARNNFSQTRNPFRGNQGGSTITQQLVKNAFLSSEHQLERKIQEAKLAFQVENHYSKDQILEFYLNYATYFNHNNYGIQAASKFYFDKDVDELKIEEAALLAGMIRKPSRLSPHENPEGAISRQRTVLQAMNNQGFISANEYREALDRDLDDMLEPPPERKFPYPHFVNYIINEEAKHIIENKLEKEDHEEVLYHNGLTIHTTMDRELQSQAENIINDPGNYPENWEDENGIIQPQGALVLSDPNSGELKALVGGRDYNYHNMLNRVVSTRSPGSAMKPINVYSPAIEEGLINPSSAIDDSPTAFEIYGEYYTPENFDQTFTGLTTVRDSLVRSLNVPAVKVYDKLSIKTGIEYAESFGITTFAEADRNNLAGAIGGLERGVKPIDLSKAYGALANEGKKMNQHAITKIKDRHGNIIYENNPEPIQVISSETAWLINDMLKDVITEGTASSLNLDFHAAAKTGTSHNYRDAWLVGYTPNIVATFWLGYDRDNIKVENRTNYTTKVIEDIMSFALKDKSNTDFKKPDNIEGPISVSTKSGLRPSSITPNSFITEDYFVKGSVPTQRCDAFVQLEVCTEHESAIIASDNCPSELTTTKTFLDRDPPRVTDNRWNGGAGRTTQDKSLMPPTNICNNNHDGSEEDKPEAEEEKEELEEEDEEENIEINNDDYEEEQDETDITE
ncbi:transglycosylase domain-containing protein [Natranaerofaba carboxydovora]|uniref:transglycosylase domain-containing protein n=1 Tax=Natranaerofaba carboxydovora TaxID=2742683 RepID=UPI001F1444C4|nr:PBP1A family penicillin-binding protein [Natranaerofaba carboxydovora]UMZ73642.1 Penicillin-binding protein 1F [Natranaerofaba carboxydovora]